MRTTFYDSKRNPSGVLGSKATGEPSVLMGVSALLAIRQAITATKKDLGEDPKAWFNLCEYFFSVFTQYGGKMRKKLVTKTYLLHIGGFSLLLYVKVDKKYNMI